MKRLLIGMFALGLFLLARDSSAAAKSYTMTVTTNTPTGSATLFTNGGYPNISGGAFLDTLVITGVAAGTTQTVTLYDLCTSSMVATAKMPIIYTGTATVVVPFPTARYKMTNPCIAVDGTAAPNTKATFIYE